jgi:hypothetical protein
VRCKPKNPRRMAPASYEVIDGTHVIVVPMYTSNPNNGQTGNTRWAGIRRSKERRGQRSWMKTSLAGLFVPRTFRKVRLVRLAPSNGLDTGGLWAALKSPQDGVADHLGIDDGPSSPATWEMAQERSVGYGVRVELRP